MSATGLPKDYPLLAAEYYREKDWQPLNALRAWAPVRICGAGAVELSFGLGWPTSGLHRHSLIKRHHQHRTAGRVFDLDAIVKGNAPVWQPART